MNSLIVQSEPLAITLLCLSFLCDSIKYQVIFRKCLVFLHFVFWEYQVIFPFRCLEYLRRGSIFNWQMETCIFAFSKIFIQLLLITANSLTTIIHIQISCNLLYRTHVYVFFYSVEQSNFFIPCRYFLLSINKGIQISMPKQFINPPAWEILNPTNSILKSAAISFLSFIHFQNCIHSSFS